MSPAWLSPTTGSALTEAEPGLLADRGGRRWPAIDGIPYLRVGRDALVAATVERLRHGDREGALVLLLADQDEWWTGAKPSDEALRHLVREQDRLSLREAMDLLGLDRVGTYFAHRWTDPTFLAGLALLEAYRQPVGQGGGTAFELACGIGHYGRALARCGVRYTGGDVVFSKLWLARHWVLPQGGVLPQDGVLPEGTALVCLDAAAPWPVAGRRFDLVFCHDAFYFLEPKAVILATLRGLVAPGGRLALSHIHNSGADNLSAGRAVSAEAMAGYFPDAAIFDDAELTLALADARAPRPAPLDRLGSVEAFSVEDGASGRAPAVVAGGLAAPPEGGTLRINPLYAADGDGLVVAWPSPRYETEYGPRATYPRRLDAEAHRRLTSGSPSAEYVRRRVLVDLPERW